MFHRIQNISIECLTNCTRMKQYDPISRSLQSDLNLHCPQKAEDIYTSSFVTGLWNIESPRDLSPLEGENVN